MNSTKKTARVAGFTYLFAMATAVFAEMCVRGQLILPDNAEETARNIMAQERLWRLTPRLSGRSDSHERLIQSLT